MRYKILKNTWIDNELLKRSCNRLFLNSTQQEQMVCQMGEWVAEEWRSEGGHGLSEKEVY